MKEKKTSRSNYRDPFKIINNSFDIEEVYNATLDAVFSEIEGNYYSKIKETGIISTVYKYFCKNSSENKIRIYQLLKTIKVEKSYNILENHKTHNALKNIINLHHHWIRNPLYWKKESRNPYKQIESLITYLFCKHAITYKMVFTFSFWEEC